MPQQPSTPLPLTYLEAGEANGGTPLLVLHGLFGSARNWQTLARRFAESRRVYALDLRNHGGAPWADSMSYEAMADDVLRFLDDRGFARAAVIGHSMGGKVAMTLALRHPDRVERLVVVDIAPTAYTHTHAPFVAAMKAADLEGRTRRPEIESQLVDAVPEAPLRSFLMQNLVLEEGKFSWRINLDAIGGAMADLIGFPDPGDVRYAGPTLFIGGTKSDYILPEHHDLIRRRFPKAEIAMIEGAGHWLHAERPQEFAGLVERFV
ncbi:alpha/beta fold hydrolase [Azospirillum doebereinerae]|uniref:Alpha/beta fold hydrolase n=1 Tax=Azospirillum doebereinerae TaxID=92933 RepID=A0A433J242_9PROT|nr:alpha/beta fold hydrolase [Azospirillum doebereinerae]RUQ65186.1 alpha/beta fold hydrolase [Azospirillum doebereinerae]